MRRLSILGFLLVAALAGATPTGTTVLGLYKSSENQTAKENEIFFHLSRPLGEMGLQVRYWDIDEGIPQDRDLTDVRAIVSWFRGPAMADPKAYAAFVARIVDSGRKFVILDNYGAYQNRATQAYVDPGTVNIALSRIGLLYQGDWTADPSLYRIATNRKGLAEKGGRQDPSYSQLYYRFLPVDRNLKVHLSLRRTDSYDRGESPIITTNGAGGFALSRYVYRVDGGKLTMLIDLKAFLEEAFFPGPDQERVALVIDAADEDLAKTARLTQAALEGAKIPFEVLSSSEFSRLLRGDLRRFTTIGLVMTNDSGMDPALLESFLTEGGSLVSLVGGRFDRLAGLLSLSDTATRRSPMEGYRFRLGFALGEGFAPEDADVFWTAGTRMPGPGVEIIATSYDGLVPLVWKTREGRVIVWNWDVFRHGDYQGLLVESFLAVRPVGVAATPGIGVMHIDDWPLPMFNIVKQPYAVTDTEFYTQTWWPEITALLERNGMPFTTYAVFNYNATVAPPFPGGEFFVAAGNASVGVGRDIVARGQELALHGYNHISLTREKTINIVAWPSSAAMVQSLRQAREEWIRLFGAQTLPFSYVAPNNIISPEGEEAVLAAFPEIKVISSLRVGGGRETQHLFGVHPNHPDVFYLPRTSSGYPFDSRKQATIASSVAGPGVWAHFVHADDVYDPIRSRGLSWDELKGQFQQMIDFVRRNYPWLRQVTTRQAYATLTEEYRRTLAVHWIEDEKRLVIEGQPGQKVRVRLNDHSIRSVDGARRLYDYKRPSASILELESNRATVILR